MFDILKVANKIVSNIPYVQTASIPKDFSHVFDKGEESTVSGLGLKSAAVDKIWSQAEAFYETKIHNAVSVCVRREGKVILNRSLGMAHGDYGESKSLALNVDSPFCMFSASKAVSAVLLCKISELGFVKMSDPIQKYIPEFGEHGKHETTLEDLVSHRGKVPMIDLDRTDQIVDHDLMLERLCSVKPSSSKQAYHAITNGFIIAEIIQRTSGMTIVEALDRYFRKPMEMKFFTYGLEKQHQHAAVDNHMAGIPLIYPTTKIPEKVIGFKLDDVVNMSNESLFKNAVIPAGNMFATAEELTRFYQMLLDGGEYNGKQIMKPETIRKAIKGSKIPTLDGTFKLPVSFSKAGFMLNTPPMYLMGFNAPKAYGHLGLINIIGWADPERKISAAIMTSGKPFLGPHLLNFSRLINSISDNCPKVK